MRLWALEKSTAETQVPLYKAGNLEKSSISLKKKSLKSREKTGSLG